MVEIKENYGSDKKGNCDICGLNSIGKLNGNELCKKHFDNYRTINL